jgi:uncharacterized protein
MPYIEGRIVHDADSHMMEVPGFYEPFVDPKIRDAVKPWIWPGSEKSHAWFEKLARKHEDEEFRRDAVAEIMGRKNFEALGAFRPDDRPAALDALGVQSQLVFTTQLLGPLVRSEHGDDPDLAYGVAEMHNRGMADFCSADRRMLPVFYVPLVDVERSPAFAEQAVEGGAAALMISSLCPKKHSPSHVGLDGVWAAAQEAGIPVVLHVGGGRPLNPTYKENGLPAVPDFHGGDDNFTSVSFMAIPDAPMQTLSTMIFDGVLDRFPELKVGVIEQGAAWVPGWMRSMDAAADAFRKNEERLQRLSLKPSEYVQRQIRVTPYPHEPAGWIIKEAGPSVCLFSTDYPHVEGGRHPIKRFATSTEGCSDTELDAFYRTNFEDLMGSALAQLTPA